jgi:hypothetical protein
MKKLILRIIGLDPNTVLQLQNKVTSLTKTVENLTKNATDAYKKSEQAIILYKKLGINTEQERWWEKESIYFEDHETYILAEKIKKTAMKDFARENPLLQERFIFHGACLNCNTPIKKGCGECLGCCYSNYFGSGLPDLSSVD